MYPHATYIYTSTIVLRRKAHSSPVLLVHLKTFNIFHQKFYQDLFMQQAYVDALEAKWSKLWITNHSVSQCPGSFGQNLVKESSLLVKSKLYVAFTGNPISSIIPKLATSVYVKCLNWGVKYHSNRRMAILLAIS